MRGAAVAFCEGREELGRQGQRIFRGVQYGSSVEHLVAASSVEFEDRCVAKSPPEARRANRAMVPAKHGWGCFPWVVLLSLASGLDASPWESTRQRSHGADRRSLPDPFGGGLQPYNGFEETERKLATPEPLKYPKLSAEHRSFAVNTGYMSYYNPELQHTENEIERELGDIFDVETNEEVAADPFESNKNDEDKDVQVKEERSLPQTDEEKMVETRRWLEDERSSDIVFTVAVAGVSALLCVVLICIGICYMRAQSKAKAAEDVEYPAYGVTGSTGKEGTPTSGGDRKLAQSAQMYHYQHQKQQMIAFGSHQNGGNRKGLASDDDSDEGEDGDYTVYECPGLAPTGEMEVRNPMFSDDQTTPKATKK